MKNKEDKNKALSSKDLEKIAYAQGRKLGFLLDNASMSSGMKRELIYLIDEMSLEQIERLIFILEAKFLDESTAKIDKEFEKKLNDVVKKYQNEDEKRKIDLKKTINALSI